MKKLFLLLSIIITSNFCLAQGLDIKTEAKQDYQIVRISGEIDFPEQGVFPGLSDLTLHKDIKLILNSSGAFVFQC